MGVSISVIIPAYNYGHFIAECMQSVLNQTHKNWECIVVDNGSTDNTAEEVKKFTEKDTRFIYVKTAQNGVSFARNKAVELSKGTFILPLDADDKIAPTYLELAEKVLRTKPEVKLVYARAELFGASSGEWQLPAYSFRDLLIENSVFCSALFRKTDFQETGGYNENMKAGFEDWDFWIKLLKSGGEVYQIPEILFYYRIKTLSRNSQLDREKQRLLRLQIFENHKEVYLKYFNIAELIFEKYLCDKEAVYLKNSSNYKVGNALLAPLRFVRYLLKR
jgi:glycosyltransferase involved in cell wall biosynthesis